MAGATIVGAVDAWSTAIDTFGLNFTGAHTWQDKIESLDVGAIRKKIGRIDLLLASPECTNHTFAKGKRRNGIVEEQSRNTAFQVIRFAKVLKPRWIVVENVVSMRRWELYEDWMNELTELGYDPTEITLNAQAFGVPQSRRRLFILCDLNGKPTGPLQRASKPIPVKSILHSNSDNGFSYKMTPVFGRKPKRAKDTKVRAKRAIDSLGEEKSFLLVYYGTDAAGGWQSLDRPLRTITTLDRFALVSPSEVGHVMRMLQPPELAKAMGFPDSYHWPKVTRRERIKLVGNAVAPPVMAAIVKSLIPSGPLPSPTRRKKQAK